MSKFCDVVDYVLILTFILKLSNLIAALVVSNGVSQELIDLYDFFLLKPEDCRALSVVDSIDLVRLAKKMSIIRSTLKDQAIYDVLLIICLTAKGVYAHISWRTKGVKSPEITEIS